jgi:putative membrane protein
MHGFWSPSPLDGRVRRFGCRLLLIFLVLLAVDLSRTVKVRSIGIDLELLIFCRVVLSHSASIAQRARETPVDCHASPTRHLRCNADAPEECMYRKSSLVIGATIVAAGVLVGAQAPAQSSPPATKGQSNAASGDQTFVTQAVIAGMAEVELGKMATQSGSNAKVKSFGQQMVTDHTKAGDELKSIATAKGMTLPTSLDPMHQATRDKLAKLSGAEFDRAYMEAMVSGHQTVAKTMMTEASSGSNPELKAFAAKTLPTVQMHLKMAQDIQKEVSGTTSTK